jgi:hypothetical protein
VAPLSQYLGYILQSFFAYFARLLDVLGMGGWLAFLILLAAILYKAYMDSIQIKYILAIKWTFLRIRVPEENQRNPRSMEEAFNAIHGIEKKPDLLEIYLDGYVQSWISLEFRGTHEGVSFVMRVPTGNVPLVQAAIYAQYPEAEIEEVSDYMINFPIDRLEKDFDLWGTEMVLGEDDALPIKTYVDFEDEFAEESRYVDSIASITEVLGSVKPGEEIWIQIVARPAILADWKTEGKNLALKLAGREVPKKQTLLDQAFENLGATVGAIVSFGATPEEKKKEKDMVGILKLTPGEVDLVKAIQRNVSKAGYEAELRIIYIAALPVYSRRPRVTAMLGLFRQFIGHNSFRLNGRFTTSRPTYGFVKKRQFQRKRRLLKRFQLRYFAESGFVLNVEELATLYHFPVEYVKAPAIERTRSKRGEAPHNVPLSSDDFPLA